MPKNIDAVPEDVMAALVVITEILRQVTDQNPAHGHGIRKALSSVLGFVVSLTGETNEEFGERIVAVYELLALEAGNA